MSVGRPWKELTAQEKRAAVKFRIRKESFNEIAAALGTTKGAVATVVRTMRASGELPPPQRAFARNKPRTPAPPSTPSRPKLRVVSNNVDLMVKDFIAKKGVRRFEPGACTDLIFVNEYLRPHGYQISAYQNRFQIKSERGRPRATDRDGLFRFVDKLRVADGLEPISIANA